MAKTDKTAVQEASAVEETTQEMVQDYKTLFDEKAKAEAFDKLADLYYQHNFGSTSKTEIDLLMFSVYFDKLMEKNCDNPEAYSVYELARLFSITPSRVTALMSRKEMKYPYMKSNWKKELLNVLKNAKLDSHKIMLQIPDKNLFWEIQHELEIHGGFVEKTLTPNLLRVEVKDFLDLILEISDKPDKDTLREEIKSNIKKKCADAKIAIDSIERETLSEQIARISAETGKDEIKDLLKTLCDKGITKSLTYFAKSYAFKKISETIIG